MLISWRFLSTDDGTHSFLDGVIDTGAWHRTGGQDSNVTKKARKKCPCQWNRWKICCCYQWDQRPVSLPVLWHQKRESLRRILESIRNDENAILSGNWFMYIKNEVKSLETLFVWTNANAYTAVYQRQQKTHLTLQQWEKKTTTLRQF